jgi:hypothetical protein
MFKITVERVATNHRRRPLLRLNLNNKNCLKIVVGKPVTAQFWFNALCNPTRVMTASLM